MGQALINGVRRGWGACEFVFLSRLVTGITEFTTESTQDKDNEYGAGNEPIHQSNSNKKYGAKMKLYYYEIEAILRMLPEGKDLTDLPPFTTNIVMNPEGDDPLSRIDVPMCSFKSSGLGLGLKQGDKATQVELDMICGKPIYKK
jgi:hypothetical protein